MAMDGKGTKCRRNIAENFNRLSRVDERYRQTTDDRRTGNRLQHIAKVHVRQNRGHSKKLNSILNTMREFYYDDVIYKH